MLQRKLLVGICIFYFVLRLLYLTRLPIFNDEAIYLDWGYRETHIPGLLFYSLYDSKQPMLMWIFGILESIFADPLFAGRFVSVMTGFLTMIGIYKLGKEIADKKIALLSAFFYAIVPIFSFFDRQALMESAIGAVGIWAFFFTFRFIKTQEKKYAILIGITLGIGFFIKSTTLIFIITSVLLIIFFLWKKMPREVLFLRLFQVIIAYLAIDLLLFLQPDFWSTFSSNSRYSFTVGELLHFPFTSWTTNLQGFFQISFFYGTPLLFLASLFGAFLLVKKNDVGKKIPVFWFIISVFLDILLIKGISLRYLVSFLPLVCFFGSYAFFTLYKKAKKKAIFLIFCSAVVPFLLTVELILSPDTFIFSLGKIGGYFQSGYVYGFTSGYGLGAVIDFINSQSQRSHIIVGVATNAGNPENALFAYYEKSPKVKVTYLDGRFVGNSLDITDCLTYSEPVYFVSRGEFLTNLNKFLTKIKSVPVAGGGDFIGIYTLKNPCVGKTAELNFN